jgi:hypothetical protein
LSLPFPFFTKERERNVTVVSPDAEPEKERRQKTPADVALVFRGHSAQKPNRLHGGAKQNSTPPDGKTPAGFMD